MTYTGRPMTIDPEWPLETHMVLGTLGWDLPEAFRLPDPSTILPCCTDAWRPRLEDILKLPLEGAYPRLVRELLHEVVMIQQFRNRAQVLTQPIKDEGFDEGQQRIEGLLAGDRPSPSAGGR